MVYILRQLENTIIEWNDGKLPSRSKLIKYLNTTETDEQMNKNDKYEFNDLLHTEPIKLYGQVLMREVQSFLRKENRDSKEGVSAIIKPKWDKHDKPSAVIRAEKCVYNADRFFPEQDPLLRRIQKQEILHVRPMFPQMNRNDYYQAFAIYPKPKSPIVWNSKTNSLSIKHGILYLLSSSLELKHIEPRFYHNYPIFKTELDSFLHKIVDAHLNGNNVNGLLTRNRFKVFECPKKKR